MERITEPELMDDVQQAEAYAQANFTVSDDAFCDRLIHRINVLPSRILDLGCGPGNIAFRLAHQFPQAEVIAVDGSEAMLQQARIFMAQKFADASIHFKCELLPSKTLATSSFDIITANSLLHHLHNPMVLWEQIQYCARPGAYIQITDLFRPESEAEALQIVADNAGSEPQILRDDFYHSLLAAFTLEEVRQMLVDADLTHLVAEQISNRHLEVHGFI